MEISQLMRGFSELEDPLFNSSQWSFDDQMMNMETPMFMEMEPSPRPPCKQLKTCCSWNSCITMNQNLAAEAAPKPKTSRLNPQDHILAERRRREKLRQRFIALSALVPGLKKMDKASVLGDAIKYLKSLQEKVKRLEEEAAEISKNVVEESVAPEIEARFSGKDVLIRVHIHCEEKKTAGVVEETLALIQNHHLSVINTTAIAFATSALDITVVAQMDAEFTITIKDLVKNLRTGLKQFM